ncbi:MAG: serine/threonine protein kinase [Planctomycetaceae bacterium]|jgi:serine/threonine-protein kinase|nr:serine/threonine protein kinase [Planctomycetaceae bacterium]
MSNDKIQIPPDVTDLPSGGSSVSSLLGLPVTDDSKDVHDAAVLPSTTPPPSSPDSDATTAIASPSVVGTLAPGTTLCHFTITKYIGGGGMGRVYLATDNSLDRKVAIKVLPHQRANDEGVVARFMNEARSAARLNHEHIAQVYFCGEQDGTPFIAFEYVEGTNIRSLVEEYGTFTIPQAVNFLIQIAHALAHADSHGVIHRDVKPSNILITSEGRAKLIDMGLARLLHSSESQKDLTASGVTLGTFDYISPEQARDPRNADIRSDVYSLGCTFFYMLTGRPPFPEGTMLQKLLQHQGDLPPDVREFQPNVPVGIAQLIQKMMAKDPRQRFQSPSALIAALTSIAKTLGLKPTGPGRIIWVPRHKEERSRVLVNLPWILAVVMLLVTAFVLNTFWQDETLIDVPPIDGLKFSTAQQNGATASNSNRGGETSATLPATNIATMPRLVVSTLNESLQRFDIFSNFFTATGNVTDKTKSGITLMKSEMGCGVSVAPITFEFYETGNTVKPLFAFSPITLQQQRSPVTSNNDNVTSRAKTLVVDPTGETSSSFRTFMSAIASVVSVTPTTIAGSSSLATPSLTTLPASTITIEIRSNSQVPVIPTSIAAQRIRVVASDGYSPTLLFPPLLPVETFNERAMLTLSNCEMTFENIAIEFRVPREIAASRWTFFEIIDNAKLTFNNCVLTIRNDSLDHTTYHQDVAFFRSVVPPLGLDTYGSGKQTPLEITMNDSVLRGEAAVFHTEIERDVNLSFNNVFVAITRPFISIIAPRVVTDRSTVLHVDLRYVSAYMLSPLIFQSRSTATSSPMIIEAFLEDSLLQMNQNPLMDFRGISNMQTARQSLRWAEKGNVLLQEVPIVWKLKPLSANTFSYDIYPATWEQDRKASSQFDVVKLDLPPQGTISMSRMTPNDMTLSQYQYESDTTIKAGANRNNLPVINETGE